MDETHVAGWVPDESLQARKQHGEPRDWHIENQKRN